MSKKRPYSLYVLPEGEDDLRYTGRSFRDKTEAYSQSYIETLAGMGEDYFVVERNKRKKK